MLKKNLYTYNFLLNLVLRDMAAIKYLFGSCQLCPKKWSGGTGRQAEAKEFGFFEKKHTASRLPNN